MQKYNPFQIAKPVWGKELTAEKNCQMGFFRTLRGKKTELQVKIATAGHYAFFVNGEFVHYGPARAAKGFFRVDEFKVDLNRDENHIAILAINHGITSFALIRQLAFLQVEISDGQEILAATGCAEKGFLAYRLTERVQKVQRYSYQRTFAEGYRLQPDFDGWRMGKPGANAISWDIEDQEEKTLLPRNLQAATFPSAPVERWIASGNYAVVPPDNLFRDRSLLYAKENPEDEYLEGYSPEELEWTLSDDAQALKTLSIEQKQCAAPEQISLQDGQFQIFALKGEKTGFLTMDVECKAGGTLYILFDELLDEAGDVSHTRLCCCNVIRLDCMQGHYHFQTQESYAMKYCKLLSAGGSFAVSGIHIKELICPETLIWDYHSNNEKIEAVLDAAKQTFLQNSSDIFMDCPSRERAGWLCDSFFLGRSEHAFTGKNAVERNFLENYAIADQFSNLPEGMVAMCYPSDQTPEGYIPNWAMWLLIEVAEHCERTGEKTMAHLFIERTTQLLNWFSQYENQDGLLDRLPGWIFVEWSKSNDLVQDINYPTNMLYGYMLKRIGILYERQDWLEKGEKLLQTVGEKSFDGEFFVDNAVYNEAGIAVNTGQRTETCQYYAFFTGTATPDSHRELWRKLTEEFGAKRSEKGLYPEIYPSNAFIGNYLRMMLLVEYGYYQQMLEETVDYFYYMAQRTGTLWEYAADFASCNHGFASYIAQLIRISEEAIRQ